MAARLSRAATAATRAAWKEFKMNQGHDARPLEAPDGGLQRMEGVTPKAQDTYKVEPGESLSDIALRIYGTAGAWEQIYNANRDRLETPDRIAPGQQLVLPKPI